MSSLWYRHRLPRHLKRDHRQVSEFKKILTEKDLRGVKAVIQRIYETGLL